MSGPGMAPGTGVRTQGEGPVDETVRILIVDDDPNFRLLLRLVLRRIQDFELVGEADDGPTGILRAAETCPDVVLLDLMMPGMDGFEALPRIREVCPETAVVVVTALDATLAGQGEPLDAAALVEKGDIVDHLEAVVRAAVGC